MTNTELKTLANASALHSSEALWRKDGAHTTMRPTVTVYGKAGILVYVTNSGSHGGVVLDGERGVTEWHACQIAR